MRVSCLPAQIPLQTCPDGIAPRRCLPLVLPDIALNPPLHYLIICFPIVMPNDIHIICTQNVDTLIAAQLSFLPYPPSVDPSPHGLECRRLARPALCQ